MCHPFETLLCVPILVLTNIIVTTYTTQLRNILNGTPYPNQYDSPILKKNPSLKNKKQNPTKNCAKKTCITQKKKKKTTKQNMCI